MRRGFSYVLQPRPRIVAFGMDLPDVPVIPEGAPFEPARLQAETVALPARLLGSVWDTVWTPLFPPVVFTGPGFGELSDADRDLIWRRWGVPVYEQRLGPGGDVVAEECDAHEALHVRPGADLATEHRRCPCGYAGPVLVPNAAPASSAA